MGSVTNPVSLEPTSTFEIRTQTASEDDIDVVDSGVTVTMTDVNDVTSVELAPESLVNSADPSHIEFTVVASSSLVDGDVIQVTYPSEVEAPTEPITCVGNIALAADLTCTLSSTDPSIISLVLDFDTTTQVSAGEVLKFTINNNINPPSTEPTSNFDILIVNTNGYDINTFSDDLTLVTTEAAEFISPSLVASNTIAGVAVDLVFNVTLANDVPSTGLLYLFYPDQVELDSTAFSCTCLDSTSTTSSCSCVEETISGQGRITISDAFPSGLVAAESIEVTLSGFNNSDEADTTGSFSLESYTDSTNLYKIDKTDSGLVLQSDCDYPCLTCSGTNSSECLSCITDISDFRVQDSS